MIRGTLYIVGTPIGNLDDLSDRARGVLTSVSVVAAEDTRRTRKLLTHLGAGARLVSCHAHSPPARILELVDLLLGGTDLALTTDAGTPGVSDPGPALIRAARAAGVPVVPVAGPSAVTAALSASGFPADRYLFLGFLPRKGSPRRRLVAAAAAVSWPVVLFEAPGRLAALLADLAAAVGGEREVVVARELTKLHEEIRAGTLADQCAYWEEHPPKGEVTVVLAGAGGEGPERSTEAASEETIAAAIAELLAGGRSRKAVAADLVARFGVSRNEAYRRVQEHE